MDKPVVLITGSDNGIGLGMASSLLRDGYRVAAFDLSCENLAGLRESFPNNLLYYNCDITSETEVTRSVAAVIEKWAVVDILVNNACVALFCSFEEKSITDTRQEFEVNFFGTVRMIKAVLPHMKRRGRGIIHNVSSGVGITGFPGLSGYAPTKGAIDALTRTLALELTDSGIHVNLLQPPLTNTKSASPLGIPPQVMADPTDVGRKLAAKIMSVKPDVTPGFQSSLFLFLARRYPVFCGRLFARAPVRKEGSD